ncbi:MAG: ATP-binding cassette domain-containing protein [Streptosporangiaceae bacterium]
MTPAISVAGLSRRNRGQLALDNVSFDIEPGSITGLLGRNGAGKTTLLRIVAGQEFPSAGSVTVLGARPVTNDALLHRMVFVREDQHYPDTGNAGKGKHMTTWIKVARFHLANPLSYTALPWAVLAFVFAIWVLLAASAGGYHVQIPTEAVAAIYLFFFIAGVPIIGRSLPFALALGVGRRSYYAGTVLFAVSLAAVYGLALAVLQVIEQATGGWGVRLHFFRVAYILPGPWYLTWLTSFVLLTLMFVWGMWFGLVYRRWNLLGLLAVIAAPVIALAVGVVIIGHVHAWLAIGHFFTTLGAAGLTGLLAVPAIVLLAGRLRHHTPRHRLTPQAEGAGRCCPGTALAW